jgi:hypothetical protein
MTGESTQVKTEKVEDISDENKIEKLMSQYPSNYIESVAFRSIYQEKKEIKLSVILSVIEQRANRNVASDGMAIYDIKLASGDDITISRRVNNVASLFSTQHFLKNYQNAFKNSFPTAKIYKSRLFPGLELSVVNDLVKSDNSTLSMDELLDFRFLVCLFFGIYFHVELEDCYCYPTSIRDWVAFNSGISKNCINGRCKSYLEQNKEEFDPMVHFDCGDKDLNYAFTMINQLGNNNKITLDLHQNDHVKNLELSKN